MPSGPASQEPRRTRTTLIVAASVVDPFLSAKEIHGELSLDTSPSTVRHHLKAAGISNWGATTTTPELRSGPPALEHRRVALCSFF